MFRLEFKTDNDAFYPSAGMEIACILRETIVQVSEGNTSGVCRDSNGNTVGSWELTDVSA